MISKYFKIWELVDKQTYVDIGEKAWELIDDRQIIVIDTLHEKYGRFSINNWHSDPTNQNARQWCGLRTSKCTEGTDYSSHKLGKADDLHPIDINPATKKVWTAEEIRQDIKKDEAFWFKVGIRCIENGVSWLHCDTRNSGLNAILWVNP